MTSHITVTIQGFYTQFPQFNTQQYADICPQALERATTYISTLNQGRLKDNKRVYAIYLLTAHLSQLTFQQRQEQAGQGGGMVASSSVDGVSVSFVQVPNMDQWSYWLNLTPYGAELLFLLNTLTAVPTYYGGSFERVF